MEEEVGGGESGPQDRVTMRQRGDREHGGRDPRAPSAGVRAVGDAQEQEGEPRPIGVRELAGERAGDGAAPDGVLFQKQEDERRRRAEQGRREAEADEPERRVGEHGHEEDAERGPELERHRKPGERRQRRHDQERQREVVQEQRVAEVRARIPAVQPHLRKEVVVEPVRGRIVAGSVAAGGDGRQEEEIGRQVVEEDEEDRAQPDHVGQKGSGPYLHH
jgi:colicin import membrane protein